MHLCIYYRRALRGFLDCKGALRADMVLKFLLLKQELEDVAQASVDFKDELANSPH